MTGDIYRGTFHNGFRHGLGRQDYKNGDWFEGVWRYDRWWDSQKSDCKLTAPNVQAFRDTNQKLEDMDRGLAFVGQWMYGKMHGLGKITLYGGKEKFTGVIKGGHWFKGKGQVGTRTRIRIHTDTSTPNLSYILLD